MTPLEIFSENGFMSAFLIPSRITFSFFSNSIWDDSGLKFGRKALKVSAFMFFSSKIFENLQLYLR